MKILLFIALWKRQDIAEWYYTSLQRFLDAGRYYGITFEVVFIYSRDHDKKTAQKYFHRAKYIKAINRPLGTKLNSWLDYGLEQEWQYCMGLGCDDAILPEYWQEAVPYLEDEREVIGLRKLLVYEPKSQRMKVVGPSSYVYGAGRLLRRDLIELSCYRYTVRALQSDTSGMRRGQILTIPKSKYNSNIHEKLGETIEMYDPDRNAALDGNSMTRIMNAKRNKRSPIVWDQVHLDNDDVFCIDIKNQDNVNKFDKLPGMMIRPDTDYYKKVLERFCIDF